MSRGATGKQSVHAYGLGIPGGVGALVPCNSSCIRFVPTQKLATQPAAVLEIRGRYFGPVEATAVYLNGESLGDFDLRQARIELPPGSFGGSHTTLELKHTKPIRPADVSDSTDQREIKFGLESIAIT